jgi:two-component system sensor histidine kinase BaeS
MVTPTPINFTKYSTQIGVLTQGLVVQLVNLGKTQANISTHLTSRLDWHSIIFGALAFGLTTSVAISLLVMRFVHAELLRRIFTVTENATKVAKGDQLNQPVSGTDEIAELDALVHEMNDALIRAEGQRREVMSMLAHDMRAPLTSLAILLDGMAAGKYESDPVGRRERVKKFLPELARVNRMIDDLLTFEKLNAGKLRLIREKFGICELIKEVVEILAIDAELKQVRFDTECKSDVTVVADRYQLKRVLLNLCENALKHSRANNTVTVRVTRKDNATRVEILDEGPGIPIDSIDRLFEKYEQHETTEPGKGFGLGLAISRAIIELHEGKIGAGNREDRSGAVFYFSIPGAAE